MKRIPIVLLLCWVALVASAQNLSDVSRELKIFNQVYKTLNEYYVDTLNAEKNINTAIGAMLNEMDPYTEYYTANNAKDFNTMITGKYAGVGALIHYYKAEDRCVIYQLYEGKPAAQAGLKVGDVLINIDGVDLGAKGSREMKDYNTFVSNKLRGDPNTIAKVVVKRPFVDSLMTFEVHRASVQLPAVPYSGMLDAETGYIYLNSFTAECSQEVLSSFQRLKSAGMKNCVLDLRGNGGGAANEAIKIVNLFVPKGKLILKMKGKNSASNTSYATQNPPEDLNMPLVVLVNANSASASEITCGSLQDLDRAVVLGERTFGKGLVQQTREISSGGLLKLTTSHYYIPSGRCIQALDYSHRSSGGEAYRMPDSLTSLFHTEGGRPVRDGGGITPDVEIKADTMPVVLAYLSVSDEYFDYLNLYCNKHASIAPAEQFMISDADYEDFIEYIVKSKFSPDFRSVKAIEQLKNILKGEDTSAESMEKLAAFEKSLKPDMAKILRQYKNRMCEHMSADICDRYYFNAGAIRNQLKHDEQLDMALSILKDEKRYNEILGKK